MASRENPADMLGSLRDLLDSLRAPPQAEPRAEEHALQLATAVMLVEVMRADASFAPSERVVVRQALAAKFELSDDEAERLAELAESTAKEATDLYTFTSRIDEGFDMPRKIRMIEVLWQVAYADGVLSAHERHVLWRIADLLHVPQGAYVHARMRAEQQAGKP
jgi:uncharacterized tellurite resistance protein B-like protein